MTRYSKEAKTRWASGAVRGASSPLLLLFFCLFSSFEEFPRDIFLSGGVGASLKEDWDRDD